MSLITEEQVELQSIEWFKELGYQYKDGYEIAPEGVSSERDDFRQVILEERLRSALIRINPDIPNQTIHTIYLHLKTLFNLLLNILLIPSLINLKHQSIIQLNQSNCLLRSNWS